MFRKFTVRLFTIIFLPLVACQLPGGQAQPTELPTPVPTAIPTIEPIQLPTITPIAGDSIQFETIALNLSGMDIMNLDPGQQLLLLTSEEDIQKITEWITPDTLENLQQINFIEFSVIALFRSYMPSTNFHVVIEQITVQDSSLIVHAQFWQPAPNQASATVVVSPYHIIKIEKNLLPPQPIKLLLESRAVSETPPP